MCYFTEMICVLYDDDKTKGDTTKIITFNKESLEKCQNILKIQCKAGLKYSSKTLPDEINNTYGYHISCYRQFPALQSKYRDEATTEYLFSDASINDINSLIKGNINKEPSLYTRSKCTSLKPLSAFGVFPSVCLFCNKQQKKLNKTEQKLVQVETKNVKDDIRRNIEIKNDQNLKAKTSTIDMIAKKIKYHNCCRLKYNKETKALSPKEISNTCNQNIWQKEREAYKKAFDSLKYYLEETIVHK